MKNSRLGLTMFPVAVLSGLAWAGCDLNNGNGSSEVVTLVSQQASDMTPIGESGTATLTSVGSNTQVAITTAGGTDTGVQAAEIATGTCGSNGAVFALLNNVVDGESGTSITTVNTAFSALTGGKYYINVHNSANIDLIEACGNIQ